MPRFRSCNNSDCWSCILSPLNLNDDQNLIYHDHSLGSADYFVPTSLSRHLSVQTTMSRLRASISLLVLNWQNPLQLLTTYAPALKNGHQYVLLLLYTLYILVIGGNEARPQYLQLAICDATWSTGAFILSSVVRAPQQKRQQQQHPILESRRTCFSHIRTLRFWGTGIAHSCRGKI